jgi:hypothetical protein
MINFWKKVYKKNNITISDFNEEMECKEYAACDIIYEGKNAKFRVAKITPKKIGQFVTIWKRESKGQIQPFDISDAIDFVIVAVQDENKLGHFVFPNKVLCEKAIFTDKKEGKRAIRIYPPWDLPKSLQAIKTQNWQLDYFTHLNNL